MVGQSAIPYGYTLTIWCSGAAIEHSHGTPTVADTLLFLVGAIAGFASLGVLARSAPAAPLEPPHGGMIRTGQIHLLAVGLALGTAALVALIHSFAVWPLGGFTATVVYLALTGIELAAATRYAAGEDAS